jgi:hypothetical protein
LRWSFRADKEIRALEFDDLDRQAGKIHGLLLRLRRQLARKNRRYENIIN